MKKFLPLLFVSLKLFGDDPQSRYDNRSLGVPGKADTFIDREGYALGYIELHEQSAWVIYKLTAGEIQTRVAKRSDQFRAYPEIHTGGLSQVRLRPRTSRPPANMAWSAKAMSESFYMSNMSPQLPAFNRGIWAKLEAQVRAFAVAEKEIYVVTGPILPKKPTIATVPTHYYKVIYNLTPPQKMIGFILPNAGNSRSLRSFAATIDAVEAATCLDFFSPIPKIEQEKLESVIPMDAWNY